MSESQTFTYDGKQAHITRTFNAPLARVWQAWTDPQMLQQWWGPKGADIHIAKFDLIPGGMFLYSMQGMGAEPIWGKFVYREVSAPNRLVFINSFSDESGATTGNPWIPVWPLEILNELTLEEIDGKTTVTLQGHPINASDAEIKAYEGAQAQMEQGFAGTWEKLDQLLAQS